jgi:hypothetical protein
MRNVHRFGDNRGGMVCGSWLMLVFVYFGRSCLLMCQGLLMCGLLVGRGGKSTFEHDFSLNLV